MSENTTVILEQENSPSHVLVNIYLRGGSDGLHLVPPTGDDSYRKARPTLAVSEKGSLPLEGIFRLNDALKPLHAFFEKQEMAIIHQAGTIESSRSHFEAEDYLHFGGTGSGWLGRYLHLTKKPNAGPLTAVSISEQISDCLNGTAAVAMRALEEFALPEKTDDWQSQLGRLYSNASGSLGRGGKETLEAMQRIRKITEQAKSEKAGKGIISLSDPFEDGLELIARLIKADIGLRAATIELGGWDSHFGAAPLLSVLMPRFANGLANFMTKLGADTKHVTVVVLTEFGRQVVENSSLGTDHGRGGVHWVLGGGVKGGKVHAKWKDLSQSLLTYPTDVPVVHDYRGTVGAVCKHIEPGVDLKKLFPDYDGEMLPLY